MEHSAPQSFFDKLQSSVTMRPRWKFWLEHASLVMAIVLVAVGLVYLGSFVTFLWRSSKFSSLPAFGSEGYGVLLRNFPWWYLGFILLGGVALVWLIRRHTQLYRWPIIGTLGVFLGAFIIAAGVADSTHFHDRLSNSSFNGSMMPFIGGPYHDQAPLIHGLITPATVASVNGSTLQVASGGTMLTVKIVSQTHLPADWSPEVGDQIVIIGTRDGSSITAITIHAADDLPNRFPFRDPERGTMMPLFDGQ